VRSDIHGVLTTTLLSAHFSLPTPQSSASASATPPYNDPYLIARTMRIPDAAERKRVVADIQKLRKRYAGTAAEYKAPNGKESLLIEALGEENGKAAWYAVRTENFKKWFGDWERAARIEAIESIQAKSYTLNDSMEKTAAKKIFADFAAVEKSFVTDFFESKDERKKNRTVRKEANNVRNTALSVTFPGKTVGRLRGFLTYKKTNLISDIREIFENAHYAYSSNYIITEPRPDGSLHKEHSNIEAYHHFINKVTVDGEPYYVRFAVQEERTSTGKLHSAHISTVEIINKKSRENNRSLLGDNQGGTAEPAYDYIIAEFFNSVKGNFSKIVDENGEPQPTFWLATSPYNNPSPQSLHFSLFTLGCKLNQLEGEALVDAFRKAGFALASHADGPSAEGPGIVIINTCTVTSKADQKSRRLIRKALRDNPDSCVLVTGCYARLDPDEIAALEGETGGAGFRRLFVAGGGEGTSGPEKSALLDLPEYVRDVMARSPNISLPKIVESWMETVQGGAETHRVFDFKPEELTFHSRGYLKIQDGCDNNCHYCRVRLARGQSVSLPKESALERLRSFEARGCAELMITGVNIAQYRHSGADLAGLLQYLLEGSTAIALRLSSLEPEAIDERLASVLAHPRIRPHFHLSVQSGSDTVLRAMGRAYTSRTVEQAAALLRGVKDNPFLACDIIAGFPGETAADFDQTYALCSQIGFAWIHAFPYSPRPGTAAFSLKNPVCERDITRRVQALTKLALQGRRDYAQAWLGRGLSAIVEKGPVGHCPLDQCRAVSENYLKLVVNASSEPQGGLPPPPGTAISCVPVSLCEDADGEKPDAVARITGEVILTGNPQPEN